jgi:hypothetical protein
MAIVPSRCISHMADAGEAELNGEQNLPRSISSQQQQRICERGRAASVTACPLPTTRIHFFFLVVLQVSNRNCFINGCLKARYSRRCHNEMHHPAFLHQSPVSPHRGAPRPQRPVSNFYDGHDATVAFYLGTRLLWVITNDMIGAKLANVSDRMRSRRINSSPSSRRAFQTSRPGPL